MARYTGPRRRVVRRLGTELGGLTTRTGDDRPYPPGQHGPTQARRRRRASPFATRLAEKQKVRFYYGLTETQLRRYLARAVRQRGPAGENLLRLLEKRLDNVVFRLGLAPTIPAARQLVTHRHVLINGRVASIPSQEVSVDDRISVRPRSARHPAMLASAEVGPAYALPGYLEVAPDGPGGRMRAEPDRSDVPLSVRESLVVEHYAR
jgi:small subunit ribosomal protein S4